MAETGFFCHYVSQGRTLRVMADLGRILCHLTGTWQGPHRDLTGAKSLSGAGQVPDISLLVVINVAKIYIYSLIKTIYMAKFNGGITGPFKGKVGR